MLPRTTPADVRRLLLARTEIAFVDVREEDPYAQAHPLWSVQLSTTRLELDAPWRLPRRSVPVVVFDHGEGLAAPAARRLQQLGWTDVRLLAGEGDARPDAELDGLQAWLDVGYEVFRDVNVPSKAFGELVEHERHTPSLSAPEVKALLEDGTDLVVLDARRFDEYQTMSIPGGQSVPGGELALRARTLAPDPATRIIVNCAGRTRSIIGTQSLVNAGIPNPVAALRNGTIGWLLAGQTLEHGRQRSFREGAAQVPAEHLATAQAHAQALADRAGAVRLDAAHLARWVAEAEAGERTLYRWDVRTPEEYAAGHLPGFGSAPGGQLVQETDVNAAVRGARIVLADGGPVADGVRAPMAAHWLAQMGWTVGWLASADAADPTRYAATGAWAPPHAPLPAGVATITPAELARPLHDAAAGAWRTLLLDLGTSALHVKGHLPGARWLLRSELASRVPELLRQAERAGAPIGRIVLVCATGAVSQFAAADLQPQVSVPVAVLAGGQAAWVAAGQPLQAGDAGVLSPRIDRYRRPYEGTDAPRAAMQAYLDWEFGLVAQLGRDGTHFFAVLPAPGAAPAASAA